MTRHWLYQNLFHFRDRLTWRRNSKDVTWYNCQNSNSYFWRSLLKTNTNISLVRNDSLQKSNYHSGSLLICINRPKNQTKSVIIQMLQEALTLKMTTPIWTLKSTICQKTAQASSTLHHHDVLLASSDKNSHLRPAPTIRLTNYKLLVVPQSISLASGGHDTLSQLLQLQPPKWPAS